MGGPSEEGLPAGSDADDAMPVNGRTAEPSAGRTVTLTRPSDQGADDEARADEEPTSRREAVVVPDRRGPTGDLFPPSLSPPRPSARRLVVPAVAGVVAVAALVAWTTGNRSSSATGGPAATVAAAARHTAASRTAALSSTMTVVLPGTGVLRASGRGAADFTTGASAVDFTLSGPGSLQGAHLGEVFAGDTIDLSLPQLASLVPGKPWVSEPLAPRALVAPRNADVVSVLGMLASDRNRVTVLGSTTVDGRPVDAYRVTVLPSHVPRSSAAGVPAAVVDSARRAVGGTSDTVVVDVDAATGSIRRIVADVQLTVGSNPVVARVTTDLRAAGGPVHISVPPAGQVLTLSQLQAAVQGSAPTVSA